MTNYEIIAKLADPNNEAELEKLLAAHLEPNKDPRSFPKVLKFFLKAFRKSVNAYGGLTWSPAFSLVAFLMGPLYFFFRKLWLVGVMLILFMFVSVLLPIASAMLANLIVSLIVALISAMTASYFYIRKFCNDAILAGYGTRDLDAVIKEMAARGGTNLIGKIIGIIWAIGTVVMIVGILFANIILPRFVLSDLDRTYHNRALNDVQNLSIALNMYRLDNGFYPSSEQGLHALIGGYINTIPVDPWGAPYIYRVSNTEIDLISFGADKREGGTEDNADIIEHIADMPTPASVASPEQTSEKEEGECYTWDDVSEENDGRIFYNGKPFAGLLCSEALEGLGYQAAQYEDGLQNGITKAYYYNNSTLAEEMMYKDGELNGDYKIYDESGKLLLTTRYRYGEVVDRICPDGDGAVMRRDGSYSCN